LILKEKPSYARIVRNLLFLLLQSKISADLKAIPMTPFIVLPAVKPENQKYSRTGKYKTGAAIHIFNYARQSAEARLIR
jgi:hypothetical protein